jgi:hypothetical protein
MYDFIMSLNIFIAIALLATLSLAMVYSFALLESIVLKIAGKEKDIPLSQCISKHFDETLAS